jgi:hypothetical protein
MNPRKAFEQALARGQADTAEDIAATVLSFVEKGTNFREAFRAAGYADLYKFIYLLPYMLDEWVSASKNKKIKFLAKVIEKAFQRNRTLLKE